MPQTDPGEATQLLIAWRNGDEEAGRALVDVVYERLHRLAQACLRRERGATALQPTAVVNELYIALFSREPVSCENRLHFLNLAARQMRNIVIDDARRRRAAKHGGERKLSLDDSLDHSIPIDERLTSLDEALERLEKLDERAAKIVELRFFGGLTEEEIARSLNVSVATVKRDWTFARSWLLAQLDSTP